MINNLATNRHNTIMVVNKSLTLSNDMARGLSLHGGGNESALVYSVDSKQMIKFVMASKTIDNYENLHKSEEIEIKYGFQKY